ncbi:hypothetical protein [Aeoliella sp.]|uniref:hypothetical protein n=1 Tax=Aeoliella sp. TaxID=2795800 RepID=UPI003CCC28E7
MNLLQLIFNDLPTYGLLAWLVFVAIAYVAAHYGGGWGVVLGHLLVAACVVWLDLRWIETAMEQTGWDDVPDRDLIFLVGVVLRIVMINSLLLPISFLALYLSRRSARAQVAS